LCSIQVKEASRSSPALGPHRFIELDAVEPLAGKALGENACLVVQRLHPVAAALLAEEAGLIARHKRRLQTERRIAPGAAIEPRQPPAEPHRPNAK